MKEKKKWSKRKKIIVISLIVVGSLLFILGAVLLGFFIYSKTYSTKKGNDKITNTTGLVMQGTNKEDKRYIYDSDGKLLTLHGVNAGNVLLQEGWMTCFSLDPKYNDDGSLKKDKDGNIQYPEFTQEDMLTGMESNPNLKDKKNELLNTYYKSFFSEEDFRIIKEDLSLNCIRLPFYWRNILNDDLTRKDEDTAFSYIDWFLENCKKYNLYLILDLHGAPGSQNGYEHSGLLLDKGTLWTNESYQNATIDLWSYVSYHYTYTKPELGKYIATYDLLNEPQEEKDTPESKTCFDLQNKIYKAIRNNNDNHLITFECIWDFSVSPNPDDYGWTNIMYEYHHYNWSHKTVTMDAFMAYHDMKHIGSDYDVPIYIGEFTYFEDKDNWNTAIYDWYGNRGYSWTIWNYKSCVVGWWTTSWGVFTASLNLDTATEERKTDVRTCTEEEFLATCEKVKTSNCQKGTLYDILMSYKEGKRAS